MSSARILDARNGAPGGDELLLFRFDAGTARPITHFDSRFALSPLLRTAGGEMQIVCAYLEAGDGIGYHQAVEPQLLLVVVGAGWVRGESPERAPIEAGQAAFWTAGEWHETGTDTGLTAIILEGPSVSPAALQPLTGSEPHA